MTQLKYRPIRRAKNRLVAYEELEEVGFLQHFDFELPRLLQFRPGIGTGYEEIRLPAD